MKSNVFQLLNRIKNHLLKQVVPIMYTLKKSVFAAATFKGLRGVLSDKVKNRMVFFGLFESSLHL